MCAAKPLREMGPGNRFRCSHLIRARNPNTFVANRARNPNSRVYSQATANNIISIYSTHHSALFLFCTCSNWLLDFRSILFYTPPKKTLARLTSLYSKHLPAFFCRLRTAHAGRMQSSDLYMCYILEKYSPLCLPFETYETFRNIRALSRLTFKFHYS